MVVKILLTVYWLPIPHRTVLLSFLRGKDNLRISVEYLVLQNPWRQLFTSEQLLIARQRLQNVECELPPDDLDSESTQHIEMTLPKEITDFGNLIEGAQIQIAANAYERNATARRKCIEHYGPICVICGFDFATVYGEALNGFIHVHHIIPIAQIGDEYNVDPVADLRPVCPNCHAVIHHGGGCRSIDEVQHLLSVRHNTK